MTGICPHAQLFSIEMEFFCTCWLRTTILLISASHIAWDDRCAPLYPAICWDGVSLTFAHYSPDLSLPSSQDYRSESLVPCSFFVSLWWGHSKSSF
jgi:hypothetical protein